MASKVGSEKKIKKIIELYRSGIHTIEAIAKAVDIDRTTFYNWKKRNEEFAKALEACEDERMAAIGDVARSSLFKLLNGYESVEMTTEYVNAKDEDGNPKTDIRVNRRTTKWVAPNPAAVIFSLKNAEPERFMDIMHSRLGDPQGKPLEPSRILNVNLNKVPDRAIEDFLNARETPNQSQQGIEESSSFGGA